MHTPSGSAPSAPQRPQASAPEATLLTLGLEPTPLERPSKVRRSLATRILGLAGGTLLLTVGSCALEHGTAQLSAGLDNGTVGQVELPTKRAEGFG